MMLVYGNPTAIAYVRDLPECMCDAWTLELRKEFLSLEGETLRTVVQLALHLLRADISHIEAKHASARRLVVVGSQTHIRPHRQAVRTVGLFAGSQAASL